MRKSNLPFFLIALFFISFSSAEEQQSAQCPKGVDPASAVGHYLTAMQNHNFNKAYDFVTDYMTDGMSRENWAGMQKLFYQGGEVNIYGIDVRAAHAVDEDPLCERRAVVPNILRSRDKFNNQGTTEFELYTVVRSEAGTWKVDSQETLFDESRIGVWFPGAEVPAFRDAY